jgi:hypothetical protein
VENCFGPEWRESATALLCVEESKGAIAVALRRGGSVKMERGEKSRKSENTATNPSGSTSKEEVVLRD